MASSKTIGQRATVVAATAATILAATIGTNLMLVKGTTSVVRIESTGRLVQSGGLLPIQGALTLSESNGMTSGASGVLVIDNPTEETLLCNGFVLDITTDSSPTTYFDAYIGTGAISYGPRGNNTGSLVLFDNQYTGATTLTATGSAVMTESGSLKWFKLGPASSTTIPNQINVVSLNQTGSNLVGHYHVNCYYTE